MAYDLEEQEQLAALKAWWKDNGTLLIATVAAAAIAFAGWRAWEGWRDGQARQAGTLYETLLKALRAGDAKAVRDTGGSLIQAHPGSIYASMGALASARFHFERGDLKNAKAQLQWVIERSPSADFRDLARLRLAAVLLDENAPQEALKLLEEKPQDAYAAQYDALRGDLLVALKRPEDARAAYRQALDKADAPGGEGSAFRDSVQMRLDALGG